MNRILICLIILLFNSSTEGNNLSSENAIYIESSKSTLIGKVIAITDGDTFKLMTADSIIHRIRIASIDCPEKKQPYSKQAKQFTSEAIFGKNIVIKVESKDRYGRMIAKVFYNDTLVLNNELIRNGLAWHFVKYSKDIHLQQLEDQARNTRVGLWHDTFPIPPWEWRSRKKRK